MALVPDDSFDPSASAQSRWERLPGGPLLGLALGVAFSATCWVVVLLLAAEFLH